VQFIPSRPAGRHPCGPLHPRRLWPPGPVPKILIAFWGRTLKNEPENKLPPEAGQDEVVFSSLSPERHLTSSRRVTGPFPGPITMNKNIIPFAKGKRSVKEIVERFYQDLDDIEEIVIIAKDREGEWIFANSELENELEWIGSLYKFIHQGIMDDDEEDF
jgi:hypothetical protein